jgi:ribosomal 30S subunit maturation factor RimM
VCGEEGAILVPFTLAAVPLVDVNARRVVIDPPVMTEFRDEEDQGPDGD